MSNVGAMRASVIVADDHPAMAEGLSKLLADWFVVHTPAMDLAGLTATLLVDAAEVTLLDLSFGRESSLPLIPDLVAAFPATCFIVHSAYDEAVLVDAAIAAGACGFVSKLCPVDDVRSAINAARGGQVVVRLAGMGPATPTSKRSGRRAGRPAKTHRAVAALFRLGVTRSGIAARLGISVKGIDYHLSRLRADGELDRAGLPLDPNRPSPS